MCCEACVTQSNSSLRQQFLLPSATYIEYTSPNKYSFVKTLATPTNAQLFNVCIFFHYIL